MPLIDEKILRLPNVRKAILPEGLSDGGVRCRLCARRCVTLTGERGFCRTRMNVEGQIYTLVYGDLSSISANPIEKKPFLHFIGISLACAVSAFFLPVSIPSVLSYIVLAGVAGIITVVRDPTTGLRRASRSRNDRIDDIALHDMDYSVLYLNIITRHSEPSSEITGEQLLQVIRDNPTLVQQLAEMVKNQAGKENGRISEPAHQG